MMARRDMSGVNGPSWGDVRLMMQEVGAASDVRIDIHCTSAAGVNRSESSVWTVRAFEWGQWGERPPLAFETGLWPQAMYATVPGMLYGLLHKLDSKLEELRSAQRSKR
jgi:hypothetical protein